MKTAAIIAEFNPFHNGHKYLLDTVKKEYGVDRCIAIMSGDYVQRGDVAIVSKHTRAEMAVREGFSAVFELPLIYASSSAPDFAYGAVCIADALGVDYLAFGSETGDVDRLSTLADALLSPAPSLDALINQNVKSGMSYAKAVSSALVEQGLCSNEFSAPNDILAVEYMKALKKLNSRITPIAVKRSGVHHDSSEVSDNIASATYLRSLIKAGDDISRFVPEYDPHFSSLREVTIDDFYDMLMFRLHFISYEELRRTPGISEDLANKIKKCSTASDFRSLVESCKSKNFSESTIRRAFLHILLGLIENDSLYPGGKVAAPSSVRLLAMDKSASDLVKTAKAASRIRIYTKPREISDADDALLLLDMSASDLYGKVYAKKYGLDFVPDIKKTPFIF